MTSGERPRFSIVIPTFKRPGPLAACLGAVDELTYARDRFEVIVVDDGSPTPPLDVVEKYRDKMTISLCTQPNSGPAKARNTGAAKAVNQLLAFTDDDCAPAADWLDRLADALSVSPDALVGGQVVNALTHNAYSTASQSLISYLYRYYNGDGQRSRFFTSNNFAIRTDLFRKVGGFDTTYPLAAAEDREFCDRWIHLGRPMVYAPDAIIRHFHHLSLRSYWRQHFNYGRGAYSFHAARARRYVEDMKVEPMSFYRQLLCHPFRENGARRGLWLSPLMFVSQVANTLGFFVEKTKQRRLSRTSGQ